MILDLDESDMKESLDYFFSAPKSTSIMFIQLLAIHLSNFIGTYFMSDNAVFLSDSVKCWWKLLLNSKYDRTSSTEDQVIDFLIKSMPNNIKIRDIQDAKDYFFLNFRNNYEKLIPELKEFIAGNIVEIPVEVRDMLSKDKNENVRYAIEKNKPYEKQLTPPEIPEAKAEKKGFFSKLFG
jgi:hypothetical protein